MGQLCSQITAGQVVEFVLTHRGLAVFRGWSPQHILSGVASRLRTKEFAYTLDERGRLTGVVLLKAHRKQRIVHIVEILAITSPALLGLVSFYGRFYSGWRITAYRHGRLRAYRTARLLKGLSYVRSKGK